MASDRFADELARLTQASERIGLAVSGGPDSLALLLLAHAAMPDRIAAATVDHGLRDGSAGEAAFVADLCAQRGIDHQILTVDWKGEAPDGNVQARARDARYALLADWATSNGLAAVATGHHRDDVVETFLMRALRGAGVSGLAVMADSRMLEGDIRLVRPLLSWSRDTLAAIVADAGITPIDDPSNRDPSHDRARLRTALAAADLGDLSRLADSAHHLSEVDRALDWTAASLADDRMQPTEDGWALLPGTLPSELLRRLLLIGFERRGERAPRGPDLARAMETLGQGGQCVLGNTLLSAKGDRWLLSPAPARREAPAHQSL